MPQENAADACAKVRCPTDRECVHVERSLLKPSGVVGDERERAETDLAASTKTPPKTMMIRVGKDRNSSNKSLRHLPQGGRQLSWI